MSEKDSGGRPPMFESAEELQEKIMEYFKSLVTYNEEGEQVTSKPALITGLALHLGFCSRQSFYDYEKKPLFTYTIKRARMMVEQSYEINLLGKGSTGAIFALKNMGWTDKMEMESKVEVTGRPMISFGDTSKKGDEENE